MPIQVKQRGFTLIELMVIIALVAIMAGVAVPSFTRFVNNNRVTTQADEIHRFLQYARGEAVATRKAQEIEFTNSNGHKAIKGAGRTLEISSRLDIAHAPNKFNYNANGTASVDVAVLVCHEDGNEWIMQQVNISKSGRVSQELRTRGNNCEI